MTAGREKKPMDYEIPGNRDTQKRAFDDTEPLIVNGRPLEASLTSEPPRKAMHTEMKADDKMRIVTGASNRLVVFGFGALCGVLIGILLTRAMTQEPSSSGLYIEPLADIQIGIVTDMEKSVSNGGVLSIDFGPLGVRKGEVDIGHNQSWEALQDRIRNRKVAAIVHGPLIADQLGTEAFVIGLVETKGSVTATHQEHR